MTNTKNLWGELPTPKDLPILPNKLLKEQGSKLTELTSGALIGEVLLQNQSGQDFKSRLRIKVPSLNNYIFNILEIRHNINLYPVTVSDLTGQNQNGVCQTIEDYEKKLENIFTSPKVKSVIEALLAQVSEETHEAE